MPNKHAADAPEQHQYPSPSVTGGSPTVDLGATEEQAIHALHEKTQSMLASDISVTAPKD